MGKTYKETLKNYPLAVVYRISGAPTHDPNGDYCPTDFMLIPCFGEDLVIASNCEMGTYPHPTIKDRHALHKHLKKLVREGHTVTRQEIPFLDWYTGRETL